MVGSAGLDVADERAEGFAGVGEVGVLLAGDGYAGVALGVGAEGHGCGRVELGPVRAELCLRVEEWGFGEGREPGGGTRMWVVLAGWGARGW